MDVLTEMQDHSPEQGTDSWLYLKFHVLLIPLYDSNGVMVQRKWYAKGPGRALQSRMIRIPVLGLPFTTDYVILGRCLSLSLIVLIHRMEILSGYS